MFNVATPQINVCLRKERHAMLTQDVWMCLCGHWIVGGRKCRITHAEEWQLEEVGCIVWLIDSDRGVNLKRLC